MTEQERSGRTGLPELWVMAHPLELSRAIQNLIRTPCAMGAATTASCISIGLEKSEDQRDAVLTVEDRGQGLRPKSANA